jgi:dTDP-4-amino-4,6-dideoxygalactose transaminase
VYYPVPLPLQPALASLGHRPGAFPAAEAACAVVLALPISPVLGEEGRARVVEAIAAFYR